MVVSWALAPPRALLLYCQYNEETSNTIKKHELFCLFIFLCQAFSNNLFDWFPHTSMWVVVSWPSSRPSLLHSQCNREASNDLIKVWIIFLFLFVCHVVLNIIFHLLQYPSMSMVVSWPPSSPRAFDPHSKKVRTIFIFLCQSFSNYHFHYYHTPPW